MRTKARSRASRSRQRAAIFTSVAVGATALVALCATSRECEAAPPWVDRAITLPRGDWAFDLGLGIGHEPGGLGPGFNFDVAAGLTHALELGLRTGFRFGPEGRAADADAYGRLFDTETYGQGNDVVANPELRITGEVIRGDVVELALEGRVELPFDTGLGLMFGVPLAFHLGRSARIDTGVYVPVLFYKPTRTLVSIPFHLWFQIDNRLWLGPMTGVRIHDNYARNNVDVPIGFGLGYSITHALDFRTEFLFRDIEQGDNRFWGLGAGIQIRIE